MSRVTKPLSGLLAVGLVLGGGPAWARVIDLHVAAQAGGFTGAGSASGAPDRLDFFQAVRGPAAGFCVGAKLLVFDLSISFLQALGGQGDISDPGRRFVGGGRGEIGPPGERLGAGDGGFASGTLTQALLGVEMEFGLGERWVLRPRVAGGLALGTLQPVNPPLSNDEISHKGFVAQGHLSLERFFNPFLAIGVEVQAGGHYLLGGRQVVNDPSDWWRGVQLLGFVTLTAHLGI